MEVLDSYEVVGQPLKKNAKYEDLDLVPDELVGEIVDGDLYAHARPRSRHAAAIGGLYRQLGDVMDDPAGWVILLEVEIHFGGNVLVPDLAGWRRSRMPVMPDVRTFELAPDWVCEGLSPSTAWLDHGRKREIYAQHGVEHVWFADPTRQEVEVLVLDADSYRIARTAAGTERVALAPFDRSIDLAKLWQR